MIYLLAPVVGLLAVAIACFILISVGHVIKLLIGGALDIGDRRALLRKPDSWIPRGEDAGAALLLASFLFAITILGLAVLDTFGLLKLMSLFS